MKSFLTSKKSILFVLVLFCFTLYLIYLGSEREKKQRVSSSSNLGQGLNLFKELAEFSKPGFVKINKALFRSHEELKRYDTLLFLSPEIAPHSTQMEILKN